MNTGLLIFSAQTSPRLRFVLKFIFQEVLGLEHRLTTQLSDFIAYEGPKIQYGIPLSQKSIWIPAQELLFNRDTHVNNLQIGKFEHLKVFFKESQLHESQLIPYDIFSAVFWCISRMEEYRTIGSDELGRRVAKQSILESEGLLQLPIVDYWCIQLKDCLKLHFPNLKFQNRQFHFIPTFDIDLAYAFRYKSVLRNSKGILTDLMNADWSRLKLRFKVLMNEQKDPFDVYAEILDLHKEKGLYPRFFILIGSYGGSDNALHYFNPGIQTLIKFLGDEAELGIHPSILSTDRTELLRKEIEILEGMIHQPVKISRQHFLRFSNPTTYQRLIENDIEEDYSMAYHETAGFRAGTASSFSFYDFDFEQETSLRIFPSVLMDACLKRQFSPDSPILLETIQHYIQECRKVGGLFCPIWHNNSLSDFEEWAGWKKVYLKLLEEASA